MYIQCTYGDKTNILPYLGAWRLSYSKVPCGHQGFDHLRAPTRSETGKEIAAIEPNSRV